MIETNKTDNCEDEIMNDIEIISNVVGFGKKRVMPDAELKKYLPNLFKIAERVREDEKEKIIDFIGKLKISDEFRKLPSNKFNGFP